MKHDPFYCKKHFKALMVKGAPACKTCKKIEEQEWGILNTVKVCAHRRLVDGCSFCYEKKIQHGELVAARERLLKRLLIKVISKDAFESLKSYEKWRKENDKPK